MKPHLLLLAVVITRSLQGQDPDVLFADRHCNRHLVDLRLPALSDLADSVTIADALRAAADTGEELTTATIRYRKDGSPRAVTAGGTNSRVARRTLEATVLAAARPVVNLPKDAEVSLVRVNSADRLFVMLRPLTCPPEQGSTAQGVAFLRRADRSNHAHRTATLVRVLLAPNGETLKAWVSGSSGIAYLDSLALQSVQLIQIKPALVGRTPILTLVQVPVRY